VLDARDLQVASRHGALLLDGAGVLAHAGEAVAVVGPPGSGTSTLLRAVAGLVAVRSGVVRLDGADVTTLPAYRRAVLGVAFAPQRAPVAEALSVRDNLVVGAWHRRDRKRTAQDLERILEQFPALRKSLARPASQLTGGDRKILALGRALLSSPRLLLLDEPFEGLEMDARRLVFIAVRSARAEGRAIVLAVHDLGVAAALGGRVYGLRAGRTVFTGSAEAVATASPMAEIWL
jgi:branched-chain amino acid transport system ATP-binding protein